MKIIITVKTEKKKSSKADLDKTVDVALTAGELIYNKFNYKACKCICRSESTTLILTK